MRRIYSIRLIVNARNLDDCEDADSIVEQLADLIEVHRLELGDCNPEHIAARGTSATAPPVSTAQAVRMATV